MTNYECPLTIVHVHVVNIFVSYIIRLVPVYVRRRWLSEENLRTIMQVVFRLIYLQGYLCAIHVQSSLLDKNTHVVPS